MLMSDLTHRSIPCEAHEFEDENRNAPYKFIIITTALLVFASFSTNEKQNQNQSLHVRVIFPALWEL